MFLGENKGKKSFLSFIIFVHVGILYSGEFFSTAESWGTYVVVITRSSVFVTVEEPEFIQCPTQWAKKVEIT